MPRYAQLDFNNVAIGCSNLSGEVDAPNMILIGDDEDYTGWTYNDGEWEEPDIVPPEPTFPTLTRRQLRLALLSIGVTNTDVEARISLITDPMEQASALIEWQEASTYERSHPLVAEVGEGMDMPEQQVDDLWRWAATI